MGSYPEAIYDNTFEQSMLNIYSTFYKNKFNYN